MIISGDALSALQSNDSILRSEVAYPCLPSHMRTNHRLPLNQPLNHQQQGKMCWMKLW